MGLIKTGIQAGALYGIAHQGIKAYEKHNANQNQQRQQYGPPQQQQYAPPQASTRDINGYAHQTWCSGACNGQCNGSGYAHQSYCNGQCGNRCNGDQQLLAGSGSNNNVRMIEPRGSLSQTQTRYDQPSYDETVFDEKPPKYGKN